MLNNIHIIGSGRVGSAVSARLSERGLAVGVEDPELVVLCVPDGAIAEVAAGKVAPSPSPSRTRARSRDIKPPANPVSMVAIVHNSPQ